MRLSFLLRPGPSPAVAPARASPGSDETLDALTFRAGAALATLHPLAADLRAEMRLDRDFAERLGALLPAKAIGSGRDRLSPADRPGRSVPRVRPRGQPRADRPLARDLIAPCLPRPGAPCAFVATEAFLAVFDIRSLRDLPDTEMLD